MPKPIEKWSFVDKKSVGMKHRQWDYWQRQTKSQEENAWKESRGLEEEDKRMRCAAFEDAAERMLKYPEDSEDVNVGLGELKEQLGNAGRNRYLQHADREAGKEGGRTKTLPDLQARRE